MSQLLPGDLFNGQLVRLSALKADASETFALWSLDAEYNRQLGVQAARPRSADFFAEREKDQRKDEWREFMFAVNTLAEDKLIGFTELEVNWVNQVAWFAIGIGEADYRNRGYGSDATSLTISYGFRELGLYKINLSVFGYNTRARHVYEKNGFILEATQRSVIYRDCQRHDVHLMGITRPEWEWLYTVQSA